MIFRKCCYCKIVKPLTEFYKCKRRKYGFGYICKDCTKIKNREFRKNNPDKVKECTKNWRINNPDKVKEGHKKYVDMLKKEGRYSEYRKNIRLNISEERRKKHIEENREYRKNNIEKVRQSSKNTYEKNKKKPSFRLNSSISKSIWKSLKGKKEGKSWKTMVSFDLEDLKKYLEERFYEDMTFDNYGSLWSIDHIFPKSWFKFNNADDTDFRLCWDLRNLSPSYCIYNSTKRSNEKFVIEDYDKIDSDFLVELVEKSKSVKVKDVAKKILYIKNSDIIFEIESML